MEEYGTRKPTINIFAAYGGDRTVGVLSRLCSVATFCKALSVRLSHIFVDVLCSALSPQSDNDQSAKLIPRKEREGTEEDLSWFISQSYRADY